MYPHIITNNGIIGTPPVGMAAGVLGLLVTEEAGVLVLLVTEEAGVLNVLVTEEVVEFDVTVMQKQFLIK